MVCTLTKLTENKKEYKYYAGLVASLLTGNGQFDGMRWNK